jgi:hypothetical protein
VKEREVQWEHERNEYKRNIRLLLVWQKRKKEGNKTKKDEREKRKKKTTKTTYTHTHTQELLSRTIHFGAQNIVDTANYTFDTSEGEFLFLLFGVGVHDSHARRTCQQHKIHELIRLHSHREADTDTEEDGMGEKDMEGTQKS